MHHHTISNRRMLMSQNAAKTPEELKIRNILMSMTWACAYNWTVTVRQHCCHHRLIQVHKQTTSAKVSIHPSCTQCVWLHLQLHACTDVCVHLCRLCYISLRQFFCRREHNQVVLLQIKSVASLWPEICPHPLGNTYSSVLNTHTHTHTHTPVPVQRELREAVLWYLLQGCVRAAA